MNMAKKTFTSQLNEFCQVFSAAVAASAAVEARRRPTSRDLRDLGIDAGVFDKIRRF